MILVPMVSIHVDLVRWKHFPDYWPFEWEMHQPYRANNAEHWWCGVVVVVVWCGVAWCVVVCCGVVCCGVRTCACVCACVRVCVVHLNKLFNKQSSFRWCFTSLCSRGGTVTWLRWQLSDMIKSDIKMPAWFRLLKCLGFFSQSEMPLTQI